MSIYSVLLVHFDSVAVSVGDIVRQGDILGIEGTTGRSTGDHVHISIVPLAMASAWSKSNVPGMGGTRDMIVAWTANLTNPLLTHDGITFIPYVMTAGWWGVDPSYTDHYAWDVDHTGPTTPRPKVVWSILQEGRVSHVNATNRTAGLWVVIQYDNEGLEAPPGGGETSPHDPLEYGYQIKAPQLLRRTNMRRRR